MVRRKVGGEDQRKYYYILSLLWNEPKHQVWIRSDRLTENVINPLTPSVTVPQYGQYYVVVISCTLEIKLFHA